MRQDLAVNAETSGAVLVLDKGRPRTFLQLLYHSTREDDPAIRALLEVLREIWPRDGSLRANA
jgi:DNA-binding transcriptional LysR family regulator